jgi:hypothetical protein
MTPANPAPITPVGAAAAAFEFVVDTDDPVAVVVAFEPEAVPLVAFEVPVALVVFEVAIAVPAPVPVPVPVTVATLPAAALICPVHPPLMSISIVTSPSSDE